MKIVGVFGVTLSAPMEFGEFDGVWMCVCVCMMMREAFDRLLDQNKLLLDRVNKLDQSNSILDLCSTNMLNRSTPLFRSTGRARVRMSLFYFTIKVAANH